MSRLFGISSGACFVNLRGQVVDFLGFQDLIRECRDERTGVELLLVRLSGGVVASDIECTES